MTLVSRGVSAAIWFLVVSSVIVEAKLGPNNIGCKNILLISPICARSHIHMYVVLADALADRCHNVTMLVSTPAKSHNTNVTQLTDTVFEEISNEIFHFRMNEIPSYSIPLIFAGGVYIMSIAKTVCERFMEVDLVQKMLKSDDHYDLLMVSPHLTEECVLSFVHKALVEAFRELQEFQILWKWEEFNATDMSKNVKLTKWAPQQDVLGHKNIKAFVTHGGLMSTQEATYHAVPMVTIPIGADQFFNTAYVKETLGSIQLLWGEITRDLVVKSIRTVANDKRYTAAAQERASILKEQLMTPLERGVYWTEYLIRHNGAPHLRNAGRDLNLVEYYSLDVYAFLLGMMLLVLLLTYYFLRTCYRCCLCGKKRQGSKELGRESKKRRRAKKEE
ncbi:unnamed protein product [Cyprideis torosa]|uniref:Uncharacterized protein n=1 Tax=Cyprideis torosa TaxID=163714 RepID=A0A7R8W976_9CRUS|nr:unnamed protein product [Cyprideis torosa]CAG0884012.1 unnamed protein product [Cyprideis torosa]